MSNPTDCRPAPTDCPPEVYLVRVRPAGADDSPGLSPGFAFDDPDLAGLEAARLLAEEQAVAVDSLAHCRPVATDRFAPTPERVAAWRSLLDAMERWSRGLCLPTLTDASDEELCARERTRQPIYELIPNGPARELL